MRRSERLCELLSHEFVLVASCAKLSNKLLDVVDNLQISGLLTENRSLSKSLRRYDNEDSWLPREQDTAAESDASADSDTLIYTVVYNVNPTRQSLKYLSAFSKMLCPLLDAYCSTVGCLEQLIGQQMLEKDFVRKTQDVIRQKLDDKSLQFGELYSS